MPSKYTWIIPHLVSSRVFMNGLLLSCVASLPTAAAFCLANDAHSSLNARAISRGRGLYAEETQVSSRGNTRGGTHMTGGTKVRSETDSAIMYAQSRTLNIEVSRTVATDADDDLGRKAQLNSLNEVRSARHLRNFWC